MQCYKTKQAVKKQVRKWLEDFIPQSTTPGKHKIGKVDQISQQYTDNFLMEDLNSWEKVFPTSL